MVKRLKVPCHPQVVPHVDSLGWANLKLPLSWHDLNMKGCYLILWEIVKRLGLGLGTWDLGLGTWDLGSWTWDLKSGNRIENRE